MRAKQRATGSKLFSRANAAFRSQNKSEGYDILRELLKKAPYSYDAYYAVKWLANAE